MRFEGQNFLVLGGSGELGAEIASAIAAEGAQVIATASTEAGISRIPTGVHGFTLDLTSDISIDLFVQQVTAAHNSLDGIVVASGRVGFALSEETSMGMFNDLMTINATGPAAVINALFPLLKNHSCEKAVVMGITGIVVDQTFPGMSAYTASKTALSAYLQSIAKEWRRYKIRTLDVRLGHTETGLATRPLFGQAPQMPTGHNPEMVVSKLIELIGIGDGVISGEGLFAGN